MDVVNILYPNMRYDIDSVMAVADLWTCRNVNIYAMEEFDRDYARDEYKPYGMPHCLEKLQSVIKGKLKGLGAVIEVEDVSTEDKSDYDVSTEDKSDYDVDYWKIKFSITETEDHIKYKKRNELRTTYFTLIYFYDIDPFSEEWPEMEPINALIHTNGPLDPEMAAEMLENPNTIDVYGSLEMLEYVWKGDIDEEEHAVSNDNDLYAYGTLGDYIDMIDRLESSTEE